jgi:hypothetical protein
MLYGASGTRISVLPICTRTSAAWGTFVFIFACPSDDPLYIAVWYTIGCGIVTVFARLTLLRLSRW